MEIKQAVILAGGQGKRLRPFTKDNNKCMYPINGKPFLWHLIKLLKKNGIKKVLVLTGWKAEKVKVRFPGVKIIYHYTPFKKWFREIQSTCRLENALHLIDHEFLLLYCDNWWPLNLKELMRKYNQIDAPLKPPIRVTYLGKDIGFYIIDKCILALTLENNMPIERFLEKPMFRLNSFLSFKKYYSISDPARAEETARYLSEM